METVWKRSGMRWGCRPWWERRADLGEKGREKGILAEGNGVSRDMDAWENRHIQELKSVR